MHNLFVVQWGSDFADNYNYGSQIQFEEKNFVRFSHPLIPPGTTIKTWYSTISAMNFKNTPLLPLLKNKQRYRFYLRIDSELTDSRQVKIEFYDRFAKSLEILYFDGEDGQFVYPEHAVTYTIELISIKEENFLFKYIVIVCSDVDDAYDINIDSSLNFVNLIRKESDINRDYEVTIQKGKKNNISISIDKEMRRNYAFVIDRSIQNDHKNQFEKIVRNIYDQKSENIYIRYGENYEMTSHFYKELVDKLKGTFEASPESRHLTFREVLPIRRKISQGL